MTAPERGALTGAATVEPLENGESIALFPEQDIKVFRERWTAVQAAFVDEPRTAVERADELVADTIKRLTDQFAESRAGLEREWSQRGDVSTEDLRQALRRYRSFFDRLLAM
jgi:hypothetical protein